jgi:predicted XRE-type DNA-binding protein
MDHRRTGMTKRDYVEGSGNVFADLGLAGAEDRLAKAELAQKIAAILRKQGLTQAQAAAVLGVDQPKISALLTGQLARFSIEKLMHSLLMLGQDVAITIRPRQRVRSKSRTPVAGRGRLTVEAVAASRVSKSRGEAG